MFFDSKVFKKAESGNEASSPPSLRRHKGTCTKCFGHQVAIRGFYQRTIMSVFRIGKDPSFTRPEGQTIVLGHLKGKLRLLAVWEAAPNVGTPKGPKSHILASLPMSRP